MFKKDTPGSRGPPLTPPVPGEKKVNISFYIHLSALLARVRARVVRELKMSRRQRQGERQNSRRFNPQYPRTNSPH